MQAMMKQMDTQTRPQTRHGVCPTCGHHTSFTFLGEQRWPPKVAEKLGLPSLMLMWTCDHCQTTITEPDPDANG